MNLKNKILCGILASSFVFGGLGDVQTFAMVEEDGGSSVVAVDPSVNAPDRFGNTPLMNALKKYDVEKVRDLLAKGASLEIPSEYWVHYYGSGSSFYGEGPYRYNVYWDKMKGKEEWTNAFEKFCAQEVARYYRCNDNPDTADNLFYKDTDHRRELAPKAREIAEIILKHCVEKGIHLNVNPNIVESLGPMISCEYTIISVFEHCVKEIFERYKTEHSDLFTSESGRELYYLSASGVSKLFREDGRWYYSFAAPELKI